MKISNTPTVTQLPGKFAHHSILQEVYGVYWKLFTNYVQNTNSKIYKWRQFNDL